MSRKRPSAQELQRRAGQRALDRLPPPVIRGLGLAGLLDRQREARSPHPGRDHTMGPWEEWRPPFIRPDLGVRWFHVARRCACGEVDRRWLEREPDFSGLAGIDGSRTIALAKYLELVGIELPDPSTL